MWKFKFTTTNKLKKKDKLNTTKWLDGCGNKKKYTFFI